MFGNYFLVFIPLYQNTVCTFRLMSDQLSVKTKLRSLKKLRMDQLRRDTILQVLQDTDLLYRYCTTGSTGYRSTLQVMYSRSYRIQIYSAGTVLQVLQDTDLLCRCCTPGPTGCRSTLQVLY